MSQGELKYRSDLDHFESYHEVHHPGTGPALPALGHALAGAIATAGTKALLYPIDLVTTRLQVQRTTSQGQGDVKYTSFLDATQKIYRDEGVSAFYTGCAPDVAKGIADSFLFFLAYSYLRQHQLRKDGVKQLSIVKELGVGIGAGVAAKLVTTPLQNIITRQQTAALVAARDSSTQTSKDHQTIREIGHQIYAERGLSGFWAGYSASTILTLNPAITFATDNLLKRLLPTSQRGKQSPSTTFLLAAISKVIATSLTYPVMLAKSRAQASPSNRTSKAEGTEKNAPLPAAPSIERETNRLPASDRTKQTLSLSARKVFRLVFAQQAIFLSLRKIYLEEGLSGLYAGIEGELLKGFLSHGLTMAVKEKVHRSVIQTYYLLLRLLKRWPEEVKAVAGEAKHVVEAAKGKVGDVEGRFVEGAKEAMKGGGKKLVSHLPADAGAMVEQLKERAETLGGTIVEGTKNVAGDSGTTVSEGAKKVVEEGKKIIGGEGSK
ncbi:hypothetical protein LTR62_008763 [Meristemomyces frigidus]|uniref:Peroxisomal adenine nucleotide transporter 1 n=1 Tax=Meristemomyces frigidus TaxID=1508187 RepID=A0AAN7YCF0_9PEZI|nr:hypothetical protein LTR62_008763 [Meristemomyces frigidus]